jgi:serine/threonine protein phosphatase PrpC
MIVSMAVRQANIATSDKFMLMACDGLWDVYESQAAVDFIASALPKCRNDYATAAQASLNWWRFAFS